MLSLFSQNNYRHLLSGLRLLFLFLAVPFVAVAQRQISPPLHTRGYQILDSKNHVVRLTSVNWYGFDQKEFVPGGLDHASLAQIVEQIHALGVNFVRLPWANETFEKNPVVPDYAVKANPQFRGKRALDVMDTVVSALARAGIMIVLDNHVSRADWCCKDDDGNGLWYSADYPEEKWLADWRAIVLRYRNQKWVVGADLRNELRSGAQWGGNDPRLDWHAAAERGGNVVLDANPRLLAMVEGPEYSTDFSAFGSLPLTLKVPNRVVYSPHAVLFGSAHIHQLRRDETGLRRARWFPASPPARSSPVGRRIWDLPVARLRREQSVVHLVYSILERKESQLELLAAERNTVFGL